MQSRRAKMEILNRRVEKLAEVLDGQVCRFCCVVVLLPWIMFLWFTSVGGYSSVCGKNASVLCVESLGCPSLQLQELLNTPMVAYSDQIVDSSVERFQ